MSTLAMLLLSVLCSVVAAEITDSCAAIAEKLLVLAASRLPSENRQRYLDEWHGDLDCLTHRRGKLSILFWSVGVYVNSVRLAQTLSNSSSLGEETSQVSTSTAESLLSRLLSLQHDLGEVLSNIEIAEFKPREMPPAAKEHPYAGTLWVRGESRRKELERAAQLNAAVRARYPKYVARVCEMIAELEQAGVAPHCLITTPRTSDLMECEFQFHISQGFWLAAEKLKQQARRTTEND